MDGPHPVVVATSTALPAHRYAQAELASLARHLFPQLDMGEGVLARFFRRVGVEDRHLALPAEVYGTLGGLGARSAAWLEVGLDLGRRVLEDVLGEAGVPAGDVRQIMSTSVTGLSVPSLEARLMNRIPFALDTRRLPLFGLGCLGGAACIARTYDTLRAYPDELAVLFSVELCSLTLQPDDVSIANVIASGLFGDGAAAVLMAGGEHPLARGTGSAPRIVDVRSAFFPDTERLMGWDIVDRGFKVVLDPGVPELVRTRLPPLVDAFLAEHGLTRDDISSWVCHPGGPAVIDAIAEGLGLDQEALAPSRESLARVGNLSSASVLFVLDDIRRRRRPPPGAHGVLMAMGPAFAAELVLLRW